MGAPHVGVRERLQHRRPACSAQSVLLHWVGEQLSNHPSHALRVMQWHRSAVDTVLCVAGDGLRLGNHGRAGAAKRLQEHALARGVRQVMGGDHHDVGVGHIVSVQLQVDSIVEPYIGWSRFSAPRLMGEDVERHIREQFRAREQARVVPAPIDPGREDAEARTLP